MTDLFRRVVIGGHAHNYVYILFQKKKLCNKQWDNFIAHLRDHHSMDILQYPDYEGLRKVSCRELSLT